MQNRKNLDAKTKLAVMNDKHGQLLFTAIEQNKPEELQKLIEHGAGIGLNVKKDGQTCLEYAGNLERWDCVLILINHSHKYIKLYVSPHFGGNGEYVSNYITRMSSLFFLAIKQNRIDVIEAIFSLFKNSDSGYYKSNILYQPILSWKSLWKSKGELLQRDDDSGYTSLHLAVKNKNYNSRLCEIIGFFAGNSEIFTTKDKHGQTAFDLAVSLDLIDCARKIAVNMMLEYVSLYSNEAILLKTLFHDIRFDRVGGGHSSIFSDTFNKKQENIFQYLLCLPIATQKKYFEMILDSQTTFYQFFNYRSSDYNERILNELVKINEFPSYNGNKAALVSSSTKHVKECFNKTDLGRTKELTKDLNNLSSLSNLNDSDTSDSKDAQSQKANTENMTECVESVEQNQQCRPRLI